MSMVCDLTVEEEQFDGPSRLDWDWDWDWDSLAMVFGATHNDDDCPSC
jgi:hypothetical protein